jgi:hypothetical protein
MHQEGVPIIVRNASRIPHVLESLLRCGISATNFCQSLSRKQFRFENWRFVEYRFHFGSAAVSSVDSISLPQNGQYE